MVYRGPQGLTIYLVRRTFRLLQEKFEHIWFRQESGRVIAKAPNGTLKRHAKIRKLSPVPPRTGGGRGQGSRWRCQSPCPQSKHGCFRQRKNVLSPEVLIKIFFDIYQNALIFILKCLRFNLLYIQYPLFFFILKHAGFLNSKL